jgi:hypothetical protein
MKRILTTLFTVAALSVQATELYVAPNGNDAAAGTLEQPLTSLGGARDAVRAIIAGDNGILKESVTVYFRGGTYHFDETVVFGLEDSGSAIADITYAAYGNETPIFSGGVPVDGWKQTKHQDGEIWKAPVPWAKGNKMFHALFDGDELLTRSRSIRYYNSRELHKAPAWDGDRPRWKELMHEQTLTYISNRRDEYSKLHTDDAVLLQETSNVTDVDLFIRPSAKWLVNYLPLKSYDPETGVLQTSVDGTYPLIREFYLEHALEFIAEPGEWSLNTEEGMLFYWPKSGTPSDKIVAPSLPALIRVEGINDVAGYADKPVRGLTFKGLTLTHANRDVWTPEDIGVQHDWDMWDKENALLRFRGAEDCVVDSCHFINSGSAGVRVDLYGQNITIQNNVIRNLGGTGVLLSGYGPGHKDVNRNNLILNNEIENVGTLFWHSLGIFVWQSGENRIAHNRIHNLGYTGVVISGVRVRFFGQGDQYYYRGDDPERREFMKAIRWSETTLAGKDEDWDHYEPYMHARNNLIEYNEIYNCMQRLRDGNCIYLSATGAGNVVRRNLVHSHVKNNMIRVDDDQFYTLVTENLVIGNASDGGLVLKHINHLENNVLIQGTISGQAAGGGPQAGSAIKRNIIYQIEPNAKGFTQTRMLKRLNAEDIDYNLYYAKGSDVAQTYLSESQNKGFDLNALAADPLFEDVDNLRFKLAPESPAFELGIHEIEEMETMGLLHAPGLERLRNEGGLSAMMNVELNDSKVFIITGHKPSLLPEDRSQAR